MRNAQHQVGDSSALTKVGNFIASLFKGARDVATTQDVPVANPQNDENRAVGNVVYAQHAIQVVEIDKVPPENWQQAMDRVVPETQLTPEMFKPSPRFFTNWSQYKLIHTLFVRRVVSRRELGELVDIANIPDLVARMNRLGWAICCRRKGELDSSGRCRYRGYYSLSEEDRTSARWKLDLVQHGYV